MQPLSTTSTYPALRDLDQESFSALVEPFRPALRAHCYRMLGSLQEAEDAAQETLWRAWQKRESYAGRAPVRSWLYKIATNLCLDALRQRPKRTLPVVRDESAASPSDPIPAGVEEPIWLEPCPEEWLMAEEADPEAQVTRRESVTLAFMASLHLLPPRQRAVLILRDVLEWQASEVAELLDQTVPSVKSALHRARATLAEHYKGKQVESLSLSALEASLQEQLQRYVQAWETADVEGLLALLKADATFSMPPIPSWYQGKESIGKLVGATIFSGPARGRWRARSRPGRGTRGFGLALLDAATTCSPA